MAVSIYIHFPYCLYKCSYCDFNSYAYAKDEIPGRSYANALLQEMESRARDFEKTGTGYFREGEEIGTIFFGGGTPSLMDPQIVAEILETLQKRFRFSSDIEITLESNPGTVDVEKFRAFREAGINRISMGIQSFHDKYLGAFGRIHTGLEAERAIESALNADFKRVSGDLIFGFPGETFKEWESDMDKILFTLPTLLGTVCSGRAAK